MNQPVFHQVDKAVREMIDKILQKPKERFYLLMAPMQSGKTQFIEDMYCEFKKNFPNAMGLYVVSHNHKDFIAQNFLRLEHLASINLHCLTLKERRLGRVKKRPLKSFTNEPIVIFFDENHFGDAVEQTIDQWLEFNKLYPAKNVYLIGVSATPFSSILRAFNTTTIYDSRLMPSYKSVTTMLERGDIEEATPLIKIEKRKMVLIDEAPAFKYLQDVIVTKNYGYVILRIPKKEHAEFLEKELVKRFGKEKIHVRHWNQSHQLETPNEYFATFRKNVITIVLVQQKARMGNTITTRFAHMVYDYSPAASVATIAQGLLGRMCGHNKISDQVKVFSHLRQATAYSLFEQGNLQEFFNYVSMNGLKASQRSLIATSTGQEPVTEILKSKTSDRASVLSLVRVHLEKKFKRSFIHDGMVVRRLSKNDKEGYWYREIIDRPLDDSAHKKLLRDSDKVSVLIDDRKTPHTIYVTLNTGEYRPVSNLVPKPSSIYSQI